jgi:hypothetical protein
MTVCVASVCYNGTIVGAADRMVSAGHLESEPPRSKIYNANNYPVTFLYAGGLSLFGEVTHAAFAKVEAAPESFRQVGDFAYLYADTCAEILTRKAERFYLLSRGFTLEQLNRNSPPVVSDQERAMLLNRVASYEPENDLEVLVVGHNADGVGQIWRVINRHPECLDTDGWGAIGIGAEEAENYFRLTGYTSSKADFGTALLTTYIAKSRGERAAGVGHRTDMFVRVAGLNPVKVTKGGLNILRALYKELRRTERRAQRKVMKTVQALIETEQEDDALRFMFTQPQLRHPSSEAPQSPPESTHDQ